MAAPRNVTATRDEEKGEEDDSPSAKKPKSERFPLNTWEFAVAVAVFFVFSTGLFCVYLSLPSAAYTNLKLPRTLSDLRLLKEHLSAYASNHPAQFILGYCSTYIFMQTFMIPGTIFMSLLAGALFGVVRGILLVVFNATAGASSCFFLSKLIGRPLVSWLWPEKLRFFQAEIAKRRDRLLNYMLFLRITPTLPNLFINLASPIVDVPFHIFFSATLIGLVPASYITVRSVVVAYRLLQGCEDHDFAPRIAPFYCFSCFSMLEPMQDCHLHWTRIDGETCKPPVIWSPKTDWAGLALGDLKSIKDLYDFKTLSVLFLIGFVSIAPTLLKRKRVYE
ncbi:putative membrane protein [Glycine max]|nr:putative membrane protein [Glycine max]